MDENIANEIPDDAELRITARESPALGDSDTTMITVDASAVYPKYFHSHAPNDDSGGILFVTKIATKAVMTIF